MTREVAVKRLRDKPYLLGHAVGFDKLTELHNEWIKAMVVRGEDATLQAHRGSYKTTCVSIALALIMVLFPNDKTLFLRKTDTDVKEIVAQVKKILETPAMQYFVYSMYGVYLKFTVANSNELSTNLTTDIKGSSQLIARGINGGLTGKHFDRIFTDDIVTLQDRISRVEREYTKTIYQELQNVKNRGGRIFNTGTPWHKEDAFSVMPAAKVYDCYTTGLITAEELETIKNKMELALFAANYEMRHIASDAVLFKDPQTGGDPSLAEHGEAHIDAAYNGEDYTAFTIYKKAGGKHYVFGKLWRKHVDEVEDLCIEYRKQFLASRFNCENNGDKGYLAKELRSKGEIVHNYHEKMNKYIKITSYLKHEWDNVIFVEGTDKEYIDQICEFNIDAEHDDAPDSLASMIRQFWGKETGTTETTADAGQYLMFL